ncbi:hypothetical protein D6783_04890 [Candidatus Woesearchaeota archaeon]|nr:MAG: hypothetical protein D6783_04890 [Candidatus Woesearchaeota archaeon]
MLTHPLSFLVLLGILLGLFLKTLEHKKVERWEWEVLTLWGFGGLWFHLLVYKNALLLHGFAALWKNIPGRFLWQEFSSFSLPLAVHAVGIIPLFYGVFAVFHILHTRRESKLFPAVGIFLVVLVALFLQMVSAREGLALLGVTVVLLSSQGMKWFSVYVRKVQIRQVGSWEAFSTIGILVAFLLSSGVPSVVAAATAKDVPSRALLEAVEWIGASAPQDAVILALPEEGFLIKYLARRGVAVDQSFMLVKNPEKRLGEVEDVFSAVSLVEALDSLEKLGATYVVVSDVAKRRFGIEGLRYADDHCLPLVFDNGVKVYHVRCRVVAS